jgi:hypothetical protein
VWWEQFDDMRSAIAREKEIKKWKREWKVEMIEKMNPLWRDLYLDLTSPVLPGSEPLVDLSKPVKRQTP